ncbi:hypothetical protein CGRA01v4_12125 [Colletotrichum graminicola]|nr:hypothetical protein CGRA01v4_12125 [Colletotrichum graminicola]
MYVRAGQSCFGLIPSPSPFVCLSVYLQCSCVSVSSVAIGQVVNRPVSRVSPGISVSRKVEARGMSLCVFLTPPPQVGRLVFLSFFILLISDKFCSISILVFMFYVSQFRNFFTSSASRF